MFYESRRSLPGPRFHFRLLTNMTDNVWGGVGVPTLLIRDGAPTTCHGTLSICQLQLLRDTAENETQVGSIAWLTSAVIPRSAFIISWREMWIF